MKVLHFILGCFILGLTFGIIYRGISALSTKGGSVHVESVSSEKLPPARTTSALIRAYGKDLRKYTDSPERLLAAVISTESSFNPRAKKKEPFFIRKYGDFGGTSHGLMQIMGFMALRYHVSQREIYDPEVNIPLGVSMLVYCLEREKGNLIRGLACNNQGPHEKYKPKSIEYAQGIVRLAKTIKI